MGVTFNTTKFRSTLEPSFCTQLLVQANAKVVAKLLDNHTSPPERGATTLVHKPVLLATRKASTNLPVDKAYLEINVTLLASHTYDTHRYDYGEELDHQIWSIQFSD